MTHRVADYIIASFVVLVAVLMAANAGRICAVRPQG